MYSGTDSNSVLLLLTTYAYLLIHSMQVNSFRSANFTSDSYMYGYMYGKYCFVTLRCYTTEMHFMLPTGFM